MSRVQSFELKHGKPTVIDFNFPVKFRMEFTNGTTVEGIIPPNSGFRVCDQGDVSNFKIIIDDDSQKALHVVE